MRNGPFQETVERARRSIAASLPVPWTVRLADDSMALHGPSGVALEFRPEVLPSGTPIDAQVARLRTLQKSSELPVLLVADYLGPGLREGLSQARISYADATGWVSITSNDPLIVLTAQGANKSPQTGRSSAVVRLNGVSASRIIRTLCEVDALPIGVRYLAAAAGVWPGSVSKLLPTLTREGAINRDQRGAVTAIRRRVLIRRWTQDYSFLKSNSTAGYYIAPRGLDRTLQLLSKGTASASITGSAGARSLLPTEVTSVVPLRLLALYSETPTALAESLDLIPADPATANTIIATPQDPDVLARPTAPIGLILADLLTLPGRGEAEADQLMDTLAKTNPNWEN